jgi:hypothetical protein
MLGKEVAVSARLTEYMSSGYMSIMADCSEDDSYESVTRINVSTFLAKRIP